MINLAKNISQKPNTWFHPFLGGIGIKTKKFVSGLLWWAQFEYWKQWFENWFWFTTQTHTSNFESFRNPTANTNTFSPLWEKRLSEQELIGNIDIRWLQSTNRKIQKVHLKLPYKTTFFDNNGKGVKPLEKWTFINFDNTSPILSKYDEKTGKHQAYAKVISIDTSDANTIEYTHGWYIRAPWLDGIIQRENTTHSQNTIKQETNPRSQVSFKWYFWPDGREIPEYILKSVTINYFGKILSPKINTQLNSINQNIRDTRQKIVSEVMWKNIKASETTGYRIQQWYIKQRETWSALDTVIHQITLTNNIELNNPNIAAIMQSIQSKTDWQKIIQQAAYVYRKQRLWHTSKTQKYH